MNVKNYFSGDERAVSPVIGVILMVAITVILAAVIGTFVLGLGDELSDTAPQVSMSVDDVDTSANNTTLRHTGGDSLQVSELTFRFETPDGSASFDGSESSGSIGPGDKVIFDIDTVDNQTYLVLPNGPTITDESLSTGFSSGDEITISIVHGSSGEFVYDKTITV